MNTKDTHTSTTLNLHINHSINITGNTYKDWDIELVIKEAVKYIVHSKPLPRDLKRVLSYYGIIDHFYPESMADAILQEEGDQGLAVSGGDRDTRSRSPESVERARERQARANGADLQGEGANGEERSYSADSLEAGQGNRRGST